MIIICSGGGEPFSAANISQSEVIVEVCTTRNVILQRMVSVLHTTHE
jgi:hypothetical protein